MALVAAKLLLSSMGEPMSLQRAWSKENLVALVTAKRLPIMGEFLYLHVLLSFPEVTSPSPLWIQVTSILAEGWVDTAGLKHYFMDSWLKN